VSPSRWQYVFAHTVGLATGTSSLLFAVYVGWHCSFSFGSLIGVFWLICALLIALPLGWLLGFLCLCICGPLIFRVIAKINGAPFRAGDWVRILSGSHRDRIVCVYAVWDERGQLRVELDEQAKKGAKDVFSYFEICRESDAQGRFEADHPTRVAK
jgi:hypothetical protein